MENNERYASLRSEDNRILYLLTSKTMRKESVKSFYKYTL